MRFSIFQTDFGHMGVVYWTRGGISRATRIFLPGPETRIRTRIRHDSPNAMEAHGDEVSELIRHIQHFFQGSREHIPMDFVDMNVCTDFQLGVLLAERQIPYGKTASYTWLANRAGTRGVRAVGNALATNPFPIVVPCHRAIKSNQTIGKYQGGFEMKRRILEFEGVRFDSRGRVLRDDFLG
ncbi:MAG: methylated-DNA--[protein]-cysteine S-methyltransferase [Promethearchaeota archaeon]